jgi:cephalosporin-C deacetylase
MGDTRRVAWGTFRGTHHTPRTTVPYADLPIEQLRTYRSTVTEPGDLDAFWAHTLTETQGFPLGATFTAMDNGLTEVESYDVTFAGFGGAPIKAWLHMPVRYREPLPAVVEYIGYGGGRGLAHERILWAVAGYAHLVMDTRGQGSGWSVGNTPDPGAGSAPAQPGSMTDGILDPETYFYRRVYADAVRAVEAARAHPAVDARRVAVTGASQGGGITLAVAGLVPDLAAVAPDVPFLCDFPRAISVTDRDPYTEIVRYLRIHRDHLERALRTLSYVDGVILAGRATAPALFSVGLMDPICPPSTVYAAYNAYAGPCDILEYPYNEHEGGQAFHDVAKLRWMAARLRG